MASEGSKKKLDDERRSHDQRQHAGPMNLEAYVDFADGMFNTVLHKKHEAATGQGRADKVVGLLSAKEVQDQERKASEKKEGEGEGEGEAGAGSEKNKGVYQF